MNSSETPQPLYPINYARPQPGALRSFREGTLGNRRFSAPGGTRVRAFDNGVFGPGLGNPAETPASLHAFRDGLFNEQRQPGSRPGPLRAFRSGMFAGLGADAANTYNLTDSATIFELTSLMANTWNVGTPSSTWKQANSDAVVTAAQGIAQILANDPNNSVVVDPASLMRLGSDGLYYPGALMLAMSAGPVVENECVESEGECPYPITYAFLDNCMQTVTPLAASITDPVAALALLESTCPVIVPTAGPAEASAAGGRRGLVVGGILAALVVVGGGVYLSKKRR